MSGTYDDATGVGMDHVFDQWFCSTPAEVISIVERFSLTDYSVTLDLARF